VSPADLFLWICLICSSLIHLRSRVFGLEHFNLHYSSSAAVAALVRWSYGTLARRLPIVYYNKLFSGFGEGGAMAAARLRLALILVFVARCFTGPDVFFFYVSCAFVPS
jgi:hypothetical protein